MILVDSYFVAKLFTYLCFEQKFSAKVHLLGELFLKISKKLLSHLYKFIQVCTNLYEKNPH